MSSIKLIDDNKLLFLVSDNLIGSEVSSTILID